MSTDDTRPLPAADDETPTRAIDAVTAEQVAADEPVRATPVPAVPVPPSTAAQLPAPRPPTPAGPELRVGTVVWGLVVAVVGIGIISFAWGARIDGGLALIVLLAGAGVALLVGSLVVGARRPRRRGTGG